METIFFENSKNKIFIEIFRLLEFIFSSRLNFTLDYLKVFTLSMPREYCTKFDGLIQKENLKNIIYYYGYTIKWLESFYIIVTDSFTVVYYIQIIPIQNNIGKLSILGRLGFYIAVFVNSHKTSFVAYLGILGLFIQCYNFTYFTYLRLL